MISLSTREPIRKFFSLTFTKIMNAMFNVNLQYYNGYFICPIAMVKNMRLISKGFTLLAEVKIRLITKGVHLKEIPFSHKPRRYGVSKALTLKSFLQTFSFLIQILVEMSFHL